MKLIVLLFSSLLIASCSQLTVVSQPEEARVLWSPDGLEPWKPWPPNSWEFHNDSNGQNTPMTARGVYGDTVYVTVEKDGYRRPLPKLAQLYAFQNEALEFELVELPGTREARLREQGFVRYRGEWVRPEEEGLAEFQGEWMPEAEAYRLSQSARGLVEYNGAWLTPEEAARREREDKLAQGLVEWKGRWVTPEQAETEEVVDEQVAAMAAEKPYPDLPAPKVLGAVDHNQAQVQLYNSTGQRVDFYFSGPLSRRFELPPYEGVGVRADDRLLLPAGEYGIAIIPAPEDASGQNLAALLSLDSERAQRLESRSQWGEWPLSAGMEYSFNFTGSGEGLQERLDEFELPEVELDIEAPEIEIPELPEQERPQRGQGQGGRGNWGGRP